MANRIGAFFDFDRTLVDVNSGSLWIRSEQRAGRLKRWQVLVAGTYFLRYHLSLIDMEDAMAKAVRTMAGQREDEIEQRTRDWYYREVRSHVQPGALAALAKHRERGEPLLLLTTSSPYLGRVVQEDLGFDAIATSSYGVDADGRFTGELHHPVCYGIGKVTHALRIGSPLGVDVDASYFYSDSYTDRFMLDKVRHPRVVNPDPRLRRLAQAKGWPIVDWSA